MLLLGYRLLLVPISCWIGCYYLVSEDSHSHNIPTTCKYYHTLLPTTCKYICIQVIYYNYTQGQKFSGGGMQHMCNIV